MNFAMETINQQTTLPTTTSNEMIQVNKESARRKYDLLREVRHSVARFQHQNTGEWRFVPDSKIIKQITTDWMQRRLMVHGQTWEIPWTRLS